MIAGVADSGNYSHSTLQDHSVNAEREGSEKTVFRKKVRGKAGRGPVFPQPPQIVLSKEATQLDLYPRKDKLTAMHPTECWVVL